MPEHDLDRVRSALAELTERHGWASMQTPRNMALALTARVGAVAGHLQFAPEQAGPEPTDPELAGEIADCLVYLLALSDTFASTPSRRRCAACVPPSPRPTVSRRSARDRPRHSRETSAESVPGDGGVGVRRQQ